MRRSLLCVGALLLAVAGTAVAQVDTTRRQPPPTAGAAPAGGPADTTHHDTTGRDTTKDTTEYRLPVLPGTLPAGPLPLGMRYVFPPDSLVLSNIYTLSDLLNHIPGVYVARGGWYGQAEIPIYGSHGPLELELYLDGAPYVPLGRDSLWLDPARIPLGHLERIEVVVWPSTLQVYLQSLRQSSTKSSSMVQITTGYASIAQYHGVFATRWPSGIGLSLSADYHAINATGDNTTAFNQADIWAKFEYVPSAHGGFAYQILTSSWTRDSAAAVSYWKQTRQDRMFRAFVAGREDGLGPRADLTILTSEVNGDPLVPSRSVTQLGFTVSETWSRASLGVTYRHLDTARPSWYEVRGAWMPLRFLNMTADARHQTFSGDRKADVAHAAVGLRLPFGLSARAEAAVFKGIEAPVVATDTVTQDAADFRVAARWDVQPLSLEVARVRLDPFQPVGFSAGIKPVAALGHYPKSDYLEGSISLRPFKSLALSAWYFDPVIGGGDFQPPYHARLSAAFHSKFWRVYKSGALDLRIETAMESWSSWNLGGRDSNGVTLPLLGESFTELNVQLRILGVTAYWITRNYNLAHQGYVAGLDYPRQAQLYGIQWIFQN